MVDRFQVMGMAVMRMCVVVNLMRLRGLRPTCWIFATVVTSLMAKHSLGSMRLFIWSSNLSLKEAIACTPIGYPFRKGFPPALAFVSGIAGTISAGAIVQQISHSGTISIKWLLPC